MYAVRKHGCARRRWRGLLLLLLFWAPGVAADGVFWSLQRDGEQRGYLLGTIHSEDPRVLDFSSDFLERLAACDVYAMELVPDLPTMGRLMTAMELADDQSLAALTGEQLFADTAAALADYGVSAGQADKLKPWAAMMTLSQPPPLTGLFMDFALSLRASGYGLEVTSLETLEQQLAFLERLPVDEQLQLLRQAVGDYSQIQAVHRHFVDLYLQDSLSTLQSAADQQLALLSPGLQAYFSAQGIDARNDRMRDRAVQLLDERCVVVAVGALHLPGPRGLVALLRDAGYSVEPLPLPLNRPGSGLPP